MNKVKISILRYGMSIHPGNIIYVVVTAACTLAGIANENGPWWLGLVIALLIFGPLYLMTSYDVGLCNWNEKENE